MTFKTLAKNLPVLLLIWSPPSVADDEYTTVVTAQRDDEDSFTSDRSIEVLDEEAIEDAAPKSVPEALWDVPGVFVQHTNYGGGAPILRGFIGPQILLMVDGVRLSNSVYRTGPLQYLNLVDPLALESIEILQGPGSVLYGSDAMGGVVHAISLEPTIFGGEAGGSADMLLRWATACRGLTGHAGFEAGKSGFGVLGGFTLMGLNDLTGGRGVGEQVYSGYDQWSVNMSLMHRFTEGYLEGWHLKLGVLGSRIEDAGRTDKLFDRSSLQVYDNQDLLVWGRIHADFSSLATEADLTVSFQHFFERQDALAMKPDLMTWTSAIRDEVQALTMGLDLQMVTRFLDSRLWLQYGATWYRDGVQADRFERTEGPWFPTVDVAYPDGSSYMTYGVYVLLGGDAMRLASGHVLRLEGGYRFHGMSAKAPGQLDLPAVDFDNLGHVALGSIQYLLADRLNVAFTFSQGFRAPNLQESAMLGDTGKFFHVPSANVDPERVDTFELLARSRFWRFTLAVTGSVSLLHDLIKRVPTTWEGESVVGGKDVYHNINGGDGLMWSTGLSLSMHLPLGFSVSGHLTYTWGEERVEGGPDVPLTRIPPLFGVAVLRYDLPSCEFGNAFVETYVRFAAKQDRLSAEDQKDSRIPEGGTEGWLTLNFRAGVAIVDHVRVGLVLENVTNAKYKYHGSGLYGSGVDLVSTLELFY